MTLTLRPATQSDVALCAATALAAFGPSTLIRAIGPSSEELALAFWAAVAQSGLDDDNAHLMIVEDPSKGDEESGFVGFAKWVLVPRGTKVPKLLGAGAEAEGVLEMASNPALARRFFGEQDERHERFVGGRRHWYLECICSRPEAKGKGAGKLLVGWGVDKADADSEQGCEAYLEASPDGRPLFEKFGFRVVDRVEYLDGAYVECSMLRDARAAVDE